MLHAAPCRAPICLNTTSDTAVKAQKCMRDIIYFDFAPLPRGIAAFRNQNMAIAHHLRDRAQKKLSRCQGVTANICQGAAPGRIMTKRIGASGIRHIIFGMDAAVRINFTQFAS